jgi:hypothetical protein
MNTSTRDTGSGDNPSAPVSYVYDLEVFPNFFLAVFKEIKASGDGEVVAFTGDQLDDIKQFIGREHPRLVGYNNFNFDDPILRQICKGRLRTTNEIYEFSKLSFSESEEDKKVLARLRHEASSWTCIDLFQILGGLQVAGTLKSHEVRLGMLNIQDLPFAPGTVLSVEQQAVIHQYCRHDVSATELLYWDLVDKVSSIRRSSRAAMSTRPTRRSRSR